MSRRWALFLSGRGSTAQALFDQLGDLDVRCVVSSRKKAFGLIRAKRAGVPALFFPTDGDWQKLSDDLKKRGVQRIFLLGFMRLLPESFVQTWAGKIWNVHPSLLPAYPGAGSLQKNFQDQTAMGATVHEVSSEMDAGRKVLQSSFSRSSDWEQTQLRASRLEQRLIREWAHRANLDRRVS